MFISSDAFTDIVMEVFAYTLVAIGLFIVGGVRSVILGVINIGIMINEGIIIAAQQTKTIIIKVFLFKIFPSLINYFLNYDYSKYVFSFNCIIILCILNFERLH